NLRRETRDYVPKLIAAALIAKQPGRYGFTEIERLPPLVFDEVSVPDATGLDVLARLADTSVAAMPELNPQFVRGITPPGRGVVVRVPRARGTTASAIAKQHVIGLMALLEANDLTMRSVIRPGDVLLIPSR